MTSIACTCPRCGCAFTPTPADPAADLAASLRAECERRGHWISLDGRVNRATAALLLDRSEGTLANWRAGSNPLPFHRLGKRGAVTYSLLDIAQFVLRAREY